MMEERQQVATDLVDHAMRQIDRQVHTTISLCDTDYMAFKVAIGIGYSVQQKMYELIERHIVIEAWSGYSEMQRHRIITEMILAIVHPDYPTTNTVMTLLQILQLTMEGHVKDDAEFERRLLEILKRGAPDSPTTGTTPVSAAGARDATTP